LLELLQLVNQEYLIGATTIKPFHSIWKLDTPNHTYILKQIKAKPHKFSQLVQIMNEYRSQGFSALVPILPTKSGEFYIENTGCFYSLSPWCDGEKPSFRNEIHLKMIARYFGKLHALSRTTTFPLDLLNQQGILEYQTNQAFLESLLPNLQKRKDLNRIDRAIINMSEYYLQQSRYSLLGLTQLKNSWPLLNDQKGFCHNDPAPGNIIIHDGNCYLIDFEFSNCDLLIKEFALIALRALQATQWASKTLELLIAAYTEERPFAAVELKILPFILCFPRRFWRLCSQRYQEQLNWHEKRFQSRLWEIVSEEPKRRQFLLTWWPELPNIFEPKLGGAG
jgi:CotS family spore coat protein